MPYKSKIKHKKHQKEYYNKNKKWFSLNHKKYYKKFIYKFIFYNIKDRCNNLKNKEYKNYGGRGIKCLITEEEIKTIMERDNFWKFKKPSIDRINNDKDYTFENCQFLEFEDNRIKDRCKPILQFNLNKILIKEWKSVLDAQNEYGHTIIDCLRGKTKTSKGFIWKYKEVVK